MSSTALDFVAGKNMQSELQERKGTLFENLYIYVTNRCNMFCKHCYLGKRLIEREEMPLEMVKAHLKFWKEFGSNKMCFLGGEPTLFPFLHESVEYAHKLNYGKVIINTNLSKVAFDVINEFSLGAFTYIQTSLDGATAEIHDRIRGKGAFSQTIESVKKLADKGQDVRVIMTVNKYNVHEMIDMVKLAEKLGVTLVKFHIMSEIGNADKSIQMGLSAREWFDACINLREYASIQNERRIKISYQASYTDAENQKYFAERGYKGCVGKSKERMSVFPDGKCYICSFLFDYNDCFAELINNVIEIRKESVENSFDSEYCDKCQRCRFDGCLAEEIIYGGKTCEKEDLVPVCRLWKDEI